MLYMPVPEADRFLVWVLFTADEQLHLVFLLFFILAVTP